MVFWQVGLLLFGAQLLLLLKGAGKNRHSVAVVTHRRMSCRVRGWMRNSCMVGRAPNFLICAFRVVDMAGSTQPNLDSLSAGNHGCVVDVRTCANCLCLEHSKRVVGDLCSVRFVFVAGVDACVVQLVLLFLWLTTCLLTRLSQHVQARGPPSRVRELDKRAKRQHDARVFVF